MTFEYTIRWPVIQDSFPYVGDLLEARDTQLEKYLRSFSGCHSAFEYKHRWPQILPTNPLDVVVLCSQHDEELEDEFFSGGFNCRFEYPYRWEQITPLLVEGDPHAAVLLNHNDEVLEQSLGFCHCGGGEG